MQPDVGPRMQTPNIRPRIEDSTKYTMFTVIQNTWGAVALWLGQWTINHQENPGLNLIAAVSKLGQLSFPPHCRSLLSCRNEK